MFLEKNLLQVSAVHIKTEIDEGNAAEQEMMISGRQPGVITFL